MPSCPARTSRGKVTISCCASAALEALGYRTHEFGDSVLVERRSRRVAIAA
jgi:hypothetical protein